MIPLAHITATPAAAIPAAAIWTGARYLDLADPNPADLDLRTIARALSNVPRWSGLTAETYSIAEHSLAVAALVEIWHPGDVNLARCALLHDAPEAYLGDVSSPLKSLLPDYRAIEGRMAGAFAVRFGLEWSARPAGAATARDIVRQADLCALAAEKVILWPDCPDQWSILEGVPICRAAFRACGRRAGRAQFLGAAKRLGLFADAPAAAADCGK